MLIASIVRITLRLKDHRVARVSLEGLCCLILIEAISRRRLPCSHCGRRSRVRDHLPQRRWRHVPFWGLQVVLLYQPARVDCPDCGIKVEDIPWSAGKSSLTVPIVTVLASFAKLLAWDVVAAQFGVSWGTVRAAVRQAVEYGLLNRDDQGVLILGIDEISRKRGHIYHTQVYDLVNKRLLWSGEGREAATLEKFFAYWGPERTARIIAICCDMWAPYVDVIKRAVPQAVLVFDKFHIVRHLLDAVNKVRKMEAREMSETHPELLARSRYIWLKNPWNLLDKQKRRLGYLLRMNLKIVRAYFLKEYFRELWDCETPLGAKQFLDHWIFLATHSRMKPFVSFGRLLRNHKEGILAWFKVPIDNGATEAMNNNAKSISHRAHGYRTEEAFTLSMLHCMGNLPMPQTAHNFL